MSLFDFIEDEAVRTKANEAMETHITTINASVQDKIDEAVSGLKSKNTELLDEKKTIQEKLTAFADINDPAAALEALKFIRENEDAQLIKDGKVGELIEKRTSTMRIEQKEALEALTTSLEEAKVNGAKYKVQFEKKMIDDDIRAVAIKAGVRPEALIDVLIRAGSLYSLGTDGTVEYRDAKGNLVKNDNGDVISPKVWIDSLKESSPHYWPGSESAGALGGPASSAGDLNAKLAELAGKGDHEGYRTLRAKMNSAA